MNYSTENQPMEGQKKEMDLSSENDKKLKKRVVILILIMVGAVILLIILLLLGVFSYNPQSSINNQEDTITQPTSTPIVSSPVDVMHNSTNEENNNETSTEEMQNEQPSEPSTEFLTYPGSEVVVSTGDGLGAELTTPDSLTVVYNYYKNQLKDNGWDITKDVYSESNVEYEIEATNSSTKITLRLSDSTGPAGSATLINYSIKK